MWYIMHTAVSDPKNLSFNKGPLIIGIHLRKFHKTDQIRLKHVFIFFDSLLYLHSKL